MDKADTHRARINLAINHVANNPLRSHTIEQLAEVSHYSKYHFHRIFRALSGESVQEMVSRVRLESAAATLIYKSNRPITRIAIDHGFSSGANFTKAFTKHFGYSPSVYRDENPRNRKNSKIGKDSNAHIINNNQLSKEVITTYQPDIELAYLRCSGGFIHKKISVMYRELLQWVEDRECVATPSRNIGITWSDSHIVDVENWIYDACIAVRAGTNGDGPVGVQTLPGGLVAQFQIELLHGDSYDLSPYWDWFVGHWFVSSGYELRASPSYELYVETDHSFIVRLCLPLESSS